MKKLSFPRSTLRFLMVCCWSPAGVSTVPDYISAWKSASRFTISVLNLWPLRPGPLAIPASVALNDFDGIILHSTVSYFPINLFNLDTNLDLPFEQFDGIKIIVKQDEHVWSVKWAEFIAAKRFDVLVTSVPEAEIAKVYPKEIVGDIEIVPALTGYVPPHFHNLPTVPFSRRPVDVGYRGSIQPLSTGQLGFEKHHIGTAVRNALVERNLAIDVSCRWEDRLTGRHWIEFLSSSRIVLGTESGTRLFDFDGTVERCCREYTERNACLDPLTEEFYRIAHDEFLHRFEGNVNYAQISPRHFEAAATRSVQLLYEGQYSDVLQPYRHFLPLKRDLSNLNELIERSKDERWAQELTEATFEEIVLNYEFSYERFVERVDDAIDRRREKRHGTVASPAAHRNEDTSVLMLMAHDPVLDPRIDWMSKGLVARGFAVVEIGTYGYSEVGLGPSREILSDGRQRIRVERKRHDDAFAPSPGEINRGLTIGQQHLLGLYAHGTSSGQARRDRIEAIDVDKESDARFRFFCCHVIDTDSALIQAARQTGRFDVVLAVDLDVLAAAETIAKECEAVLIYDAHEYWPFSPMFRHWESEFWAQIEGKLAAQADLRLTVSDPLAARMKNDYGLDFMSVPNCEPLSSAIDHAASTHSHDKTIFLYLGAFAHSRNLENLITSWADTCADAVLWIQGPDGAYKDKLIELARETGLLGSRILFPGAVPETELVLAAAKADVGIIPYDPEPMSYKYCCPNKLSQYLAAGLPILTTELDFVASFVRRHDVGCAFSFSGHPSLADAVNALTRNVAKRTELSQRAQELFAKRFNWESVSQEFYARLTELLESRRNLHRSATVLDFSWIESNRTMKRLAGTEVVFAASSPPPPPAAPSTLLLALQRVWRIFPMALRRSILHVVPNRFVGPIARRFDHRTDIW